MLTNVNEWLLIVKCILNIKRYETWYSSVFLFPSEGGADNGADSPDTNGNVNMSTHLSILENECYFCMVSSWFSCLTPWFFQQEYHHTILFWHIIHYCVTGNGNGNGNGRHKPVVDIQKGMFIPLLKHIKHIKERELQCVSGFVHRWPSSRSSRHQYVSSNKTHTTYQHTITTSWYWQINILESMWIFPTVFPNRRNRPSGRCDGDASHSWYYITRLYDINKTQLIC